MVIFLTRGGGDDTRMWVQGKFAHTFSTCALLWGPSLNLGPNSGYDSYCPIDSYILEHRYMFQNLKRRRIRVHAGGARMRCARKI